jgi:ribosome-binding factor A
MPTIRQARVGEMIKRDLSEILQKEMRDPRLTMMSVTSVEVTKDFYLAKVFVSVMGTEEEKAAALKAVQGASGFLRGKLGALLELRTVPLLQFRLDKGIESGIRMFDILLEEKEFAESLSPASEDTAVYSTPKSDEDDEDEDDEE